jgi:hypothetical protein
VKGAGWRGMRAGLVRFQARTAITGAQPLVTSQPCPICVYREVVASSTVYHGVQWRGYAFSSTEVSHDYDSWTRQRCLCTVYPSSTESLFNPKKTELLTSRPCFRPSLSPGSVSASPRVSNPGDRKPAHEPGSRLQALSSLAQAETIRRPFE